MSRDSTRNAILNYASRQANKIERESKPARKNAKPEKQTEKQVMSWLKSHGFFCHVVEAKAVYNPKAGRYLTGQTVSGMPDVVGVCPQGRAVFIELKAKGKRSTVSKKQYDFLKQVISRGGFGIVCDSVEFLEYAWEGYNKGFNLERILPNKKWD